MPKTITEFKNGTYLGHITLQNGTNVYLAYSDDANLREMVCGQIQDSTANVNSILHRIISIKNTVKDKNEKKLKLFERFKSFFTCRENFESSFNKICDYDEDKIKKILYIAEQSLATYDVLKYEHASYKIKIFTVCASTAPFDFNITEYPKIFSERKIFMAMNCIMKETDSISVSHYGIVKDPCYLLEVSANINNFSVLLHSFAAKISFEQYGRYLEVNSPLLSMLKIFEKSGLKIYKSLEELLNDSCLSKEIYTYLQNKNSFSDIDVCDFAISGGGTIAIKLEDLKKEYENINFLVDSSNKQSIKLKM